MAATCASVITSTVTPKTFTIDFGTTGCTGTDGRVRSGKLVYDFSGSTLGATRYRNPGFSMNVSSINYVVDGYTVNITNKTISNTTPASLPNGTNLTWSVSANISILKPGGGTITWLCNRTKELTNTSDVNCYSGQANPIKWSKAIVKINGTATGVNTSGETYSSTATNLVRDFNCSPSVLYPHKHPFISGTILYTPGSRIRPEPPLSTSEQTTAARSRTSTYWMPPLPKMRKPFSMRCFSALNESEKPGSSGPITPPG